MTKRPAFQFYPGDWLGSQRVSLLTLEEEGAYLRLLASCWQHGSIPSDPNMIARLIGKGASTTLATTLATMFQPHSFNPALLVHDRLERERDKQDAWAEKSREGGRKSAEKRQNLKGGSTTVQPPLEGCLPNGSNQKATLLLQSTSTNKERLEFPATLQTPEFERAWEEYLEYRKKGRMKSLLPTSQVAQLKKMSEWGHDAAIKAINESISQGWQGLFEPKATSNGKQQKPRAASCL